MILEKARVDGRQEDYQWAGRYPQGLAKMTKRAFNIANSGKEAWAGAGCAGKKAGWKKKEPFLCEGERNGGENFKTARGLFKTPKARPRLLWRLSKSQGEFRGSDTDATPRRTILPMGGI